MITFPSALSCATLRTCCRIFPHMLIHRRRYINRSCYCSVMYLLTKVIGDSISQFLAIVLAVAGTTTANIGFIGKWICWNVVCFVFVKRMPVCTTLFFVNTWNVSGVTNSHALFVIATSHSPAFTNKRTSVAALNAAIPPVTKTVTLFTFPHKLSSS